MNLRHLIRRHRFQHDCEEVLELAGAFIDHLTGLLEAAGIEFVHASTLINESEHLTMFVGATATASVTYDFNTHAVEPPVGTTVAHHSSDTAVATVDPTSGAVAAVGAGTCEIGTTSTFPDGVVQESTPATVTVETPDPTSSTTTVA